MLMTNIVIPKLLKKSRRIPKNTNDTIFKTSVTPMINKKVSNQFIKYFNIYYFLKKRKNLPKVDLEPYFTGVSTSDLSSIAVHISQ